MSLPITEASKSERETASMTLESSATMHFVIFLPTQFSSTALLAASTSGSSGIALSFSLTPLPFSRVLFRSLSSLLKLGNFQFVFLFWAQGLFIVGLNCWLHQINSNLHPIYYLKCPFYP